MKESCGRSDHPSKTLTGAKSGALDMDGNQFSEFKSALKQLKSAYLSALSSFRSVVGQRRTGLASNSVYSNLKPEL